VRTTLAVALGAAAHLLVAAAHAAGRYNVLLVTLDTTRADRLGCYGYRAALTPALDELSRRGTLFEQAQSSCPMTLPAHATILTGREPDEHGLHVNGKRSLASSIPTLAGTLAAHGYQTAAFVAAFVLNARFGLNRGFETYDDDLAGAVAQEVPEPMSVYRPGDRVVDRALAWLGRATAGSARRPFFCWVHLYDPHHPYTVHPELAGTPFEQTTSYDAQVAFMDRQVGRLLAFLQAQHQLEGTLVVAVGDHGEGLGEHGEEEHGYLLNEEALHVPLLVALAGVVRAGARVHALVSLTDVYPTVLDLLGIDPEPSGSGRSLRQALGGEPVSSRPIHAQTDLPYDLFGWSPLRSVTTPHWRYIRTTKPELYDRKRDPAELRNLVSALPDRATKLDRVVSAAAHGHRATVAPAVTLDDDGRRRLAALGYVVGSGAGGASASPDGALRDIKDMLPVKHLQTTLLRDMAAGKLTEDEALAAARDLVRRSPESAPFHYRLGAALVAAGRTEEAVAPLTEALRLQPDHAEAHESLGDALTAQGKREPAFRHYAEAVRLRPDYPEARVNLGNCYARQGRVARALEQYREALRARPDFHLAHHDLAILLAREDRTREAVRHAREAVRLRPDFAPAQYQLGMLLAEEGELSEAIEHYRRALSLEPGRPEFADNLAAAYAAAGRFDEAVAMARQAMQLAEAAGRPELAHDIAQRTDFYARRGRAPGRRARLRQPDVP